MKRHLLLSLFLIGIVFLVLGFIVAFNSGYPGQPNDLFPLAALLFVASAVCVFLWVVAALIRFVIFAARTSGLRPRGVDDESKSAASVAQMSDKRASAGHRWLG